MTRPWRAWARFWFDAQPTGPLVLVRTAFGVVVTLWAISLLPDAKTFFGPHGVLPASPHRAGGWSLLDLWNSDTAAVALVLLLALAGIALAAGKGERVAALFVLAAFISLGKRNPFVGNAGDGLLRCLAVYVALAAFFAPARAARAPAWPLRLMQVQLSIVYLGTVWAKARGTTWLGGTAVGYAFRFDELTRLPLPDVGASSTVTHAITWAVLALELSLGALVWIRRLRPWVLLAGVCLHLGIEWRLRVGFFSWAMLTLYLAWVPADVAERVLARIPWLRSRRAAQTA